MKFFYAIATLLLVTTLPYKAPAQMFPNPATLSTGQGTPGTLDPLWLVSGWYGVPPNPMGLAYTPALINNNCAPGSWVNPATLPPPVNNGNWITNPGFPCVNNTATGYIYFRLTLNLPADCNGHSVATSGSYVLYLSGYVDNSISDVYVNGNSMGISGGSYGPGAQLNMTLPGPWVVGINYIDVLVYNLPNGGGANPYGLLLVANSAATTTADGDGDGIPDIRDQCPCVPGTRPNGCPPLIDGDTIICLGQSTTLYVSAAETGTYLWSNGATTDSITISPVVTTPYSVTVTMANGARDSAIANVTVNPLPVVSINPAASGICPGGSATLTASGGTSYVWNTAANTTAITVSPAATTTYSVTGTDANTCSATASAIVTVFTPPTVTITPPVSQICIGADTTLTAGGGTSYVWSNAATTAAIIVSPVTTTPYSVTATDANTCTGSATAIVTVNLLPTININPAAVQICPGANTTLTATGGTGYVWSNAATTSAITVSPAGATTYSVTGTDANTCTATATASVTINTPPVATITPALSQICTGADTTLTAGGGVSYVWSNAATATAITVSPTATSIYSVTVTDANTCTGSTSATVTVIPAIVLATINTNVACNGDNTGAIDLTVSGGQSPFSYLWNTTSTVQNPAGLAAGNYAVTVTDNAGCTGTTATTITEPLALVLTSSFVNPSCPTNNYDGSITLSATGGTGAYQFLWSNASATSDLTDVAPGNYTVTVSDANNCTAGSAFTLAYIYDFSVLATPAVTIKLGNNTTLGYTLTGNAGNFVSLWTPSTALSCTDCPSPLAAPKVTTQYQIEVKNDVGCIASDTVTVTVVPDYSIFIPNAFTPNGDGNNDLFQIYDNQKALTFLEIKIFNRIGEMIFESNDLNFNWDGTYKGVMQGPGVFVWTLKMVFIDGHNEGVKTGSVTLMR